MKNILKRYWPIIILGIILVTISILSFVPDRYLLSNDNYSPELNPKLTILRSLLSPAWRSYRVLGFASDSEQADIFRAGILGFLDLVLPNSSVAQIFSLLSIWVGTFSTAFLTYFLVRDFVKTKYAKLSFLIAGILYVTTLWTAWVFNFNMMPYITQFGFLPLVILCIYLLFEHWSYRRLLSLFLALIFFTATSVIATLFFVDIVLITFFILFFGFLFKYKLKKIFLTICIVLVTQLFWLLPFVGYTISSSNNLIGSYTNRSITASTIDLEKDMMTLNNSARFFTRLLGTTDDPATGSYIFPFTSDYKQYDFYKVIGYVPLLFSILGLVFVIAKKKYSLIPLWVVILGCLFLLKNQNDPLGGVYIWLQDNLPIFKEVFRWISSKLLQPYLITLVLTAGIGFLLFCNFLGSFLKGKWKHVPIIVLSVIVSASSLFYAEYLFTGDLFIKRALVSLPDEYYQLEEYLKKDADARIYYAPPANNGYFREYNWGFVGSQFLGYIIPNPLMDMSLSIGSSYGESAMLKLENFFESGNSQRFTQALLSYDVEYVLVDRSLVEGRYGHTLNWEAVDTYTKNWEMVWQDNFLELYKLNPNPIELSTSNNTINVFDDNVYINQLGRYIHKTIAYTGDSTFLTLDPRKLDQYSLPTNIYINDSHLATSPSVPIVADLNLRSNRDFGVIEGFDYLVASDYVFKEQDARNGLTIDSYWGAISTIYTVAESSFENIDLTAELLRGSAGDCSGYGFPTLSSLIPEKTASGFIIEGTSDLPCVYSKLTLDYSRQYVAKISLNWESSDDSLIGVCLYSASSKKCLNKEKYFYPKDGYGKQEIIIPELISNSDDLSISIYALNPTNQKSVVTIREVSLKLSNAFVEHSLVSEDFKDSLLAASVMPNDTIEIKIPVVHGRNSYIYSHQNSEALWGVNKSDFSDEIFKVYFDEGMTQEVYGQYLNQYENILYTIPDREYLWVWEGENLSNIPASLCLTYQGDDKCWVDDTFYDDTSSVVSRLFRSSSGYTNLDASYNSTSYATDTINVLKNFIVMNIPEAWLDIQYSGSSAGEVSELKADVIGSPLYSTYYKASTSGLGSKAGAILTIPQAEDSGWLAVTDKLEILKDRVTVNGWKQGWDISDVAFNNIYILYWPNLLGYLGYILLVSEFVFILVKIFKRRKYDKQ